MGGCGGKEDARWGLGMRGSGNAEGVGSRVGMGDWVGCLLCCTLAADWASALGGRPPICVRALLSFAIWRRGHLRTPCRLHARFSVVAQMPRLLAASLSPRPNWAWRSSKRRRLPAPPATRLLSRPPLLPLTSSSSSSSLEAPTSPPMSSSSSSCCCCTCCCMGEAEPGGCMLLHTSADAFACALLLRCLWVAGARGVSSLGCNRKGEHKSRTSCCGGWAKRVAPISSNHAALGAVSTESAPGDQPCVIGARGCGPPTLLCGWRVACRAAWAGGRAPVGTGANPGVKVAPHAMSWSCCSRARSSITLCLSWATL
mmetsp:Transcript_28765/g.74180  ORF Transcript_28765/g.74180 Transcript_28765/m.74180 type:complete len:314 (+) Transcript_28765:2442-3383(+)